MPSSPVEWMKETPGPVQMLGAKVLNLLNIKTIPYCKVNYDIFPDVCILLSTVDYLRCIYHIIFMQDALACFVSEWSPCTFIMCWL